MIAAIIGITALSMLSLGGLFSAPTIQPAQNKQGIIECIESHQIAALHIHPVIKIFIDGEPVPIPADVGIEEGCMREVHTHDDTGTIHVESADVKKEFPLAAFFFVWGKPFNRNQILDKIIDQNRIILMTVNGKPSLEYEGLLLEAGQEIVIQYTSIVNEPPPEPQATTEEIPPEVLEKLRQQIESAPIKESLPSE